MFGILRTFLAFWVVAAHLLGVPLVGPYAVFSFYVLSGFLMTTVMHDRYGYTAAGRAAYAVSRILRLYPAYWITAGLTLLLLVSLGQDAVQRHHPGIDFPKTPWQTIQNATMLFLAPFPNEVYPRLCPPAWALTVELVFYALIAAGISRTPRRTLLWAALSLGYVLVSHALGLGSHYRYVPIPAASLPFAVGSLVYFSKDALSRVLVRARLAAPLPWILLLTTNAALFASLRRTTGPSFVSEFGLYAGTAITAILVAVLVHRPLPLISPSWDRGIGRFSYPLYLCHWQMAVIASRLLPGEPTFGPGERGLTAFAVTTLLALAYSAGIAMLVDAPIDRFRNRWRSRSHLAGDAVLDVHHLVEIPPAVVPVLDRAALPVAAEHLHVDVVDDHHLHVGRRFGGHGVAGELDVGRREDSRLGVVDVGVLDERQVPRAA